MAATSSPETRGAESPRPTRLRSVFLVAVVASVVALALAVSGAIGLWERALPVDDITADGDAEPSLEALAGEAMTNARDVVAYVRESAARDLSKVTALLRGGERTSLADGAKEDGSDRPVRPDTQPPPAAVRMAERGLSGSGPDYSSQVPPPVVTVVLVPPRMGPAPIGPLPVFDGRDVEVTPPRMQRVRLRRASGPFSYGTSNEAGLVELVVSASGDVESAKFVTNPLNVHQSMLLSAVKAWRFRPALRNGQATRYRLRVPISRARI